MAVQTFQIPKFDISTTSTTSFDLINGNNESTTFNVMPYAGTVKRILIGHILDIGSGEVAVRRFVNGANPVIPGTPIPYTGSPGPFTEKIVANVAFDKDDGLKIEFLGDPVKEYWWGKSETDEGINVKEGDTVIFLPHSDIPLEYDMHQSLNKKYYRVQRKELLSIYLN